MTPTKPASMHAHAVQFYSSDSSLYTTAATFLAEGLSLGQPALIIATPEHRAGIVGQLSGRTSRCEEAVRSGDLILVDAQATLDLFMVDDRPHADLFHANVGRLVRQALNGRRGTAVRAYGEMVDLLWKQGLTDSAIELEMLWNKLAVSYDFALLCGYAMGSFYKRTDLDVVRRHHSHVLSGPGKVIRFSPRRQEGIAG